MGKKVKSDVPPERPLSPFIVFRNQIYPQIKQKHENLNRGDLAQVISKQWDALDKEKKKAYQDGYRQALAKYQTDIIKYQQKYGKIQQKPVSYDYLSIKDNDKGGSKSSKKHKKDIQKDDKKSKKKKKKNGKSDKETNKDIKEKDQSHKQSSSEHKSKKNKKSNKKDKGKKQDDNYRMMWVVNKNSPSDQD